MAAASSKYLSWVSSMFAPTEATGATHGPARAVFGYATGYGPAEIEPFVRSLRAHFDGSIVLTVDDRPDLRSMFDQYGVEAAPPPPHGVWRPHPVVERFAAYDRGLTSRPWITHALLADVRDVVFQDDPFGDLPDRLQVYVESEDTSLSGHMFNMKHLRAVGGDSLADTIADKPCICAGTLLGPSADLVRLCRAILLLGAIPRSGVGASFGTDQAACNIAVHLGLVDADIRENYGRVATIGTSDGDKLRVREDGVIVNHDGTVSAVVHQYDRHPHLADAMIEKWGRASYSVVHARRKSIGERIQRLSVSFARRTPELR